MFTWKGFEEHVILQVCEQSIPLAQDTTQNNTDAYGYAVRDCLNSAYRQVPTKSTQVAASLQPERQNMHNQLDSFMYLRPVVSQ